MNNDKGTFGSIEGHFVNIFTSLFVSNETLRRNVDTLVGATIERLADLDGEEFVPSIAVAHHTVDALLRHRVELLLAIA